MAEIGYTLSSEEQSLAALVANAARAEQAGFSFAGISDPERHLAAIREYLDAGYDHVYVHQVESDQEGFFDFYERELLPELA